MATFTAYIEFDEETKLYVGIVPGVPGAHTQASSLDETVWRTYLLHAGQNWCRCPEDPAAMRDS